MRSTRLARHRAQRGVSLIEAVVASALLGVGVVGGITAWDTATTSASKAVRQAWARCIVRSEVDVVMAATWDSSTYPAANPNVQVIVAPIPLRPNEQRVTVVAHDPQSGSTLFQASVLKTTELAGGKNMNSASNPNPLSDIRDGCPAP